MIEETLTSPTGERTFSVKRHDSAPENPIVSVVVPIFGAEYTLEQALQSVLCQTLHDIEIVCVNDASPDSSREIIEGFFVGDKRMTVVEHESNCGYGASMNDGIQSARGTWIAILEPDDYVKPGMYEQMLKASGRSGQIVDVVKTPYLREIRDEGIKRGDNPREVLNCSYRKRVHPLHQPFDMSDPNANHLLRHHPSIWSAIYRRSFLEDNGIRFVEYPGSGWADNEFFYETLLSAEKIVYLDEPFYVYREETDGEYDAFARANKVLPFDRWHSMFRIIEQLGWQDDEGVMRSHISKGFTYLSGELEANTDADGNIDEIVLDEMNKMFDAMPPSLVAVEPKISPALKQRYADRMKYLDKDVPAMSARPYYMGLVGEMVYAVRNNGIRFAMSQVKKVLNRHR